MQPSAPAQEFQMGIVILVPMSGRKSSPISLAVRLIGSILSILWITFIVEGNAYRHLSKLETAVFVHFSVSRMVVAGKVSPKVSQVLVTGSKLTAEVASLGAR